MRKFWGDSVRNITAKEVLEYLPGKNLKKYFLDFEKTEEKFVRRCKKIWNNLNTSEESNFMQNVGIPSLK